MTPHLPRGLMSLILWTTRSALSSVPFATCSRETLMKTAQAEEEEVWAAYEAAQVAAREAWQAWQAYQAKDGAAS